MAVSEAQFKTWSNLGAQATSASTYDHVKNSINRYHSTSSYNFEVYLQGSYRNSTNIYSHSDVDIVVEFKSIYSYDTSQLDTTGLNLFNESFIPAQYTLTDFKDSIISSLVYAYGSHNIKVGKRAITIKANNGRLEADVIVCNSYRNYASNNYSSNLEYVEGIVFYSTDGEKVINYPKVHFSKGALKNGYGNTLQKFKPVCRIFKNIKARLVSNDLLSYESAPSYFLECLLYNGDNGNYNYTQFSYIIPALLSQFQNDDLNDRLRNYVVQNEQRYLFGNTNQQWSIQQARNYCNQVSDFLNKY